MYLYLVRHGQSRGNILHTLHGWTDYPLTDLGRQQAQQAAEILRDVPFTRAVASPLQRARNTAEACIAGRNISLEIDRDLMEQNVGDIENLTWEQCEEKFPGVAPEYIYHWARTTPPGGESPEAMLARVGRAIDRIIAQGEDTLIGAHNGSLSLTLIHLGLAKMDDLMKDYFIFGQGTYSAVEITGDGPRLLFFNK